ncbi:MAG: hypothetical protein SFZ02_02585 [bacterium]|nr:hypothetical protein [bacterium]
MLAIENPPQYLDVIQHPHHFYELIFKAGYPTRPAFDEWLFYLEKIYQLPKDTSVKLLTDTRLTETIPLAYAFRKTQTLLRQYPNRPKMRLVFLSPHSHAVVEKLFQSFVQLLRTGDDIRYFYGDDKRDALLDFLFANEAENHPEKLMK